MKLGTPGFVRALDPLTVQGAGIFRSSWFFRRGRAEHRRGHCLCRLAGRYLIGLDARTGKELCTIKLEPRSRAHHFFRVDGKQMIAISTSSSLVTFALP